MKKILAIVLTLAMLLSMVAVSTSAARREAYKDDDTENNYWHFQQGNSWHPVKFSNPGTEFEMDVMLDDASSSLGCYGLSNAPYVDANGVGLKDANGNIAYTFTPGTWYNVKWVSANGSTEIFVNGATVGTVNDVLTYYDNNQFYWAPVLISMDNVKMGGQTFDFEGDNSAWNTESGQGELLAEVFEGATHNELVGKGENNYWHFQQGNSWHPVKFSNPGTEFEMDVMLDDASSSLGCYGLSNAPYVDANGVGLKDANGNIAYSFAAETWYNVKWVSANGSTEIFVNGESVGTVNDVLTYYDNNQFYWAPVLISMDNVKMGGQTFDFEGDNSAWNTESGQGELLAEEVETFREDLGQKYWHFQQGNSWHPVKFANPGTEVEFDVCLDDASSSLGNYNLSNAPYVDANSIGLKDANGNIAYTFTPGTWYNVKWVSANGSTEIFVDGKSVGTVNDVLSYYDGNQFYWAPVLLSMDNVKVGGQTFDFEGDNSAWNTESGQGELLEYPPVKPESIFDHITIEEPKGEVVRIACSYDADNYSYYLKEKMCGNDANMIVDFDLQLISLSNERLAGKKTDENSYFCFWLNEGCNNRVCIGTQATGMQRASNGKSSNDWNAFDFGEKTWHRVTVEILKKFNTINIYIDGSADNTEPVYTGTAGDVNKWITGQGLIGNAYNCTAFIDNYTVYSLDYEVISKTDLSTAEANGGGTVSVNGPKYTNIDEICATGHVPGATVITTRETCYSTGLDTTTCAACGETYTHEIPMVAHKWAAYDFNRRTADGLVYGCCRNGGCTERRYTTVPNYEGTMYQFHDFQDDLILKTETGWGDGWQINEGKLQFTKDAANYNNYSFNDSCAKPMRNNWSWSVDITFDGLFDSGDTYNYGQEVYFWFGGSSGIAYQAGYQFNASNGKDGDGNHKGYVPTGKFFLRNATDYGGSMTNDLYYDYEVEYGKTYRLGLTYEFDLDEYTAAMKLWLDGEVILQFTSDDDENAIFKMASADEITNEAATSLGFLVWRDFGVYHSLDNMAFGSADLKILPRLGDVNGDDYVSANDVVVYRRYFAGHADAAALIEKFVAEADYNQDEAVNAKDLLAVRIAIAG